MSTAAAASISEEVAQLRGTKAATIKDLLTNGPFVRLAMAMTVSSFGDWVGFVAVTSLVANLYPGNPKAAAFAVGGVMIARMLPSLVLGAFVGAIVDRFDRRKVMMAADIGRAVLYATMPFLGRLWMIYALSFAIESLSLLWSPARDATLPKLVPRRQLSNANSISIISTYATLPLGGVAFALLAGLSVRLGSLVPYFADPANQASLALWLDAGTFAFSAVMLTRIPISMPKHRQRGEGEKTGFSQVRRDAAEGVQFLRSHPLARSMTVGILIAFGGVGAVASVGTIFVQESLQAGPKGWGYLIAAVGLGMAIGMSAVNLVYRHLDQEHVFYLAMIGGGAALGVMAEMPGMGGALVAGVLLGLLVGAAWVTGYTLLQESVADEFRGRTFSALNVLSKLALLASLTFFPLLAAAIGPRSSLLVAGGAVALGGLYTRVGLHRYRMQRPLPLGLIPKLKKASPAGVFVVFEGVEGAGKGTQIELAEKALSDAHRPVMVTREPGGTPIGEKLRLMLLDHDTGHLEPRTEALLFGAARAQMVATVLRPALEAGKVVLCDRYIDSSLAYQGVGRGVGESDVLTLNVWGTQGLFPDLVVLLHIEPELGLERAGEPDRFEAEGIDFHAKVADAYLHIAEEHPERFVVIDASGSPDEVHKAVMEAIQGVLPELPPETRHHKSRATTTEDVSGSEA